MPKFQKNSKIELWRNEENYQDEAGGWHSGRPSHIATYWACVKGVDYKVLFQNSAEWGKPAIEATITRPRTNAPRLKDHIRHDGEFFIVVQVNELTGQVGHDMRFVCEADPDYHRH